MALWTAEEAPAKPCIARQYRLRYRCDNGSAVYESVNDTEGFGLLTVHADGSVSSHMIVGVCKRCMFGVEHECSRQGSDASSVPAATTVPAPAAPPPEEPVTRSVEPSAEHRNQVFRSPYASDDYVVSPAGTGRVGRHLF